MRHKLKHVLILLTLLAIFVHHSEAQKRIRLTNQHSHKEIYIKEGARIKYVLNHHAGAGVGILTKISSDSIMVNGKNININDLLAIGKKNRGSGIGIVALAALGAQLIIGSIQPAQDPCPSCQTVSSTGDGLASAGLVLGVLGGVTIIFIALHKATRNSPRNITTEWKLDVVD